MSSFRQHQTNLNDQTVLVDTLKTMGYKPQVNTEKTNVRGHYNETRKAEIILKKEDLNQGGDIGFSKDANGNFSIIADTYVMKKFSMDKFSKDVTTKYAETKVLKIAKNAGLIKTGSKVLPNGNTQLTFTTA